MRDEIDNLEEQYIGKLARLDIPLRSVVTLRRVAEELRGLAYQLDTFSRFTEQTPSVTMIEVRWAIRRTNGRLEKIRGRGRPKIGRQFKNGTRYSGC